MANAVSAISAVSGAARSFGRLSSTTEAASLCPAPALSASQAIIEESSVLVSEGARRFAHGPRVSSPDRSSSHSLRFDDDCTQSGLKQANGWSLERTAFETKAGPSASACSNGRGLLSSGSSILWQERPDSPEAAVFRLAPVGPPFSCGGSWEPNGKAGHVAPSRRAHLPVRKPQKPLRGVQSLARGSSAGTPPMLPLALLSQSSEAMAWQLYLQHLDGRSTPEGVRERAVFLEELGVDMVAAIVKCPALMDTTLPVMRAALHFLRVDVGICTPRDIERVVHRCPQILTLDVEERLLPVVYLLRRDLGLDRAHAKKVISRCPALLVQPIDTVLLPAVNFLRAMGVENLAKTVVNNPSLLSVDPQQKLLPRLSFLQEQGLTADEAKRVLARCPAIFNYSIQSNLAPKLQFLTGTMRRSVKEILSFPQFFSFSLDGRIQPRFRMAAERGLSLSLGALLALPEDAFLINCGKLSESCQAMEQRAMIS
ncbi:unnamed protein product [Closterium sp. NIES-64]|nr:unnamed protein product [Closterium sp. NIES-64]